LILRNVLEKTLEDNPTNPSENEFSNVELRQNTLNSAEDFDKKHLPSSSKCDRNAKIITQSKCDQRISLKGSEEVVLRKIKEEKANKNEGKTANDDKKQTANKISLTFKNAIKSSILRKYGAIMVCQW